MKKSPQTEPFLWLLNMELAQNATIWIEHRNLLGIGIAIRPIHNRLLRRGLKIKSKDTVVARGHRQKIFWVQSLSNFHAQLSQIPFNLSCIHFWCPFNFCCLAFTMHCLCLGRIWISVYRTRTSVTSENCLLSCVLFLILWFAAYWIGGKLWWLSWLK